MKQVIGKINILHKIKLGLNLMRHLNIKYFTVMLLNIIVYHAKLVMHWLLFHDIT